MDADMELLAASPMLRRLRWLDLRDNQITQKGIEALAASPNLPALRFAHLGDNPVEDPTPQIGQTDAFGDAILSVDIPPAARRLEAQYGKRPWLSYELFGPYFPPERDTF
jgi:hypothetical protein